MLRAEEIRQHREELSDDENIEATVQRLRRDGYSRIEAVRAILEILDVSLSEVKMLLLRNDTWEEARSAAGASSGGDRNGGYDAGVPPAPAD